jgi:predicted RNA-binding Zn-ribbon protein involved in translation (DUF1610 family)
MTASDTTDDPTRTARSTGYECPDCGTDTVAGGLYACTDCGWLSAR